MIDLQFGELGGGVSQCRAAWWSINGDPPKNVTQLAKKHHSGPKLAIYAAKNILRWPISNNNCALLYNYELPWRARGAMRQQHLPPVVVFKTLSEYSK